MENKFCYLKGIVDCSSGRIQNCNNQRATVCPLEQEQPAENSDKKQAFCYLKGLVDCNEGRVQDCNVKRVDVCPID